MIWRTAPIEICEDNFFVRFSSLWLLQSEYCIEKVRRLGGISIYPTNRDNEVLFVPGWCPCDVYQDGFFLPVSWDATYLLRIDRVVYDVQLEPVLAYIRMEDTENCKWCRADKLHTWGRIGGVDYSVLGVRKDK